MCKDDAMPPRLEPGTPTERVQIVAPRTWIEKIDEWRRQQPAIPSRSEAIRVLVEQALKDRLPLILAGIFLIR
jgi:hypothetical protein